MNCMANGLGSRRPGAAHKNSQVALKHDEDTLMDNLVVEKDHVVLDAKPLSGVYVTVEDANLGNQISRFNSQLCH